MKPAAWLCLVASAFGAEITGVVRGPNGSAAARAEIRFLTAANTVAAAMRADAEGRFAIPDLAPGDYQVVVNGERLAVRVAAQPVFLEVALGEPRREAVTVTASPGAVEPADRVAQAVNRIDSASLALRAKSVVAQAAAEEPGLALQRTSPTISGIFVRGSTGNKVNVFVDGVRYSTGAQRGGINTFLNLIDAATIDSLEVLRGPGSAQYGSDAIGGSIQFLSPPAAGAAGWRGGAAATANSADAGFGSDLSTSYSERRFAVLARVHARRANTLRTGGGIDSRSAVTRFLGLPSRFGFTGRTPDTAFTQYGGVARAQFAAGTGGRLVAHYQRGQQDGGRRYDQLLGGDGNLIADLRNLMLDFGYLRYARENVSITYSYNVQREERVNQGGSGNPLAAINREPERTRVHGVQVQTSRRLGGSGSAMAGGDFYDERTAAPSYSYNPVTGAVAARRGRVPDNARYRHGGVFAQAMADALRGRLRLTGAVRWNAASYLARAADSPRRLWPDDSLRVLSPGFRAGAVLTVKEGVGLFGGVSRGFRAPHTTDLGTLGLTGSGFEVAAADLADVGGFVGGFVGSTAGADAVSTGRPVRQVGPETALAYEGGLRLRGGRARVETTAFVTFIGDNLARQALILPAGSVGRALGGERIISQTAAGAVFVGLSASPVLVRTNLDQARIAGVEQRFGFDVTRRVELVGSWTWLHARDRASGLAPNMEGGTPPLNGYARLRFRPARRLWIEPLAHAAWRQDRLSSLDLADRRIGAGRTRDSIAAFFRNGAAARGIVRGGVLLATGETLAEVQTRVLGAAASAPLFRAVNGYAVASVRGGIALGERQDVIFEFENLLDRNYRGISWGIDGPGRGVYIRYAVRY